MRNENNFKRVLLKLSGEAFIKEGKHGICPLATKKIAEGIQKMCDEKLQVGVVVGGGNIFRGVDFDQFSIDQTPADQIGMLATLMNGIALQEALKALGCKVCLMSGLECPKIAQTYNWSLAKEKVTQGEVVIFVGGTGNPYFTTDTAAALRACEIQADLLLKATKVDGVYDKDPKKYQDAKKFSELTYQKALESRLKVMDATAFALCQNNRLTLFVFNLEQLYTSSLTQILKNKAHGTLVKEDESCL